MTLGVLGCSARTFVAFPGVRDGAFPSDPPTPAPDAGNTSDATVPADLAPIAADLVPVSSHADVAGLADLAPVPTNADVAGLADLAPVPTNADVAGLADLGHDATGNDAPMPPDLLSFDLPALLDRPGDFVTDLPPADRINADLRPDASRDALDGSANGPGVLFYDGFDDGFAAKWSSSESSDGPVTDATDGSNKIATLDATQTENARLRCNLDGSYFTDINISASMKVRIEGTESFRRRCAGHSPRGRRQGLGARTRRTAPGRRACLASRWPCRPCDRKRRGGPKGNQARSMSPTKGTPAFLPRACPRRKRWH
jgi:hypothetical protein